MLENSAFYPPFSLERDLNRFPICALSLCLETLHLGKVLPGIEGQKAAETRKTDFWSVTFSEKDLD